MAIWLNTRRGKGLANSSLRNSLSAHEPRWSALPKVENYLSALPWHTPTQSIALPDIAPTQGVAKLTVKDESTRHGLGSFKALGGAYAVAQTLLDCTDATSVNNLIKRTCKSDITFVCASAGNHGLSVAAGCKWFGAQATIVLSNAVPEEFSKQLSKLGAHVIRSGDCYEESVLAASVFAESTNAVYLPDGATTNCLEMPQQVMEGYLAIVDELDEQLTEPPTHVFLQGGVGGFAASMTVGIRGTYGDAPTIIVVEPSKAPCLLESTKEGKPIIAGTGISNMGRLDCKETSLTALSVLARETDAFMTIEDGEALEAVRGLQNTGLDTSPSGGAGLAGISAMLQDRSAAASLGIDENSHLLAFMTEGRINI